MMLPQCHFQRLFNVNISTLFQLSNPTVIQRHFDIEMTLKQQWVNVEMTLKQRWINADVNVVISSYIQRQ